MIKDLVNINEWCNKNGVEILAMLRILKNADVTVIRIGGNRFVSNEAELDSALNKYFTDTKTSLEKRSEIAKARRLVQSKLEAEVTKMLAAGKPAKEISDYIARQKAETSVKLPLFEANQEAETSKLTDSNKEMPSEEGTKTSQDQENQDQDKDNLDQDSKESQTDQGGGG